MSSRVEWTGDQQVKRNMAIYGMKVKQAVVAVANYFAPILETYSKQNAGWEDRTGNARQSLHAFVQVLSNDVVELYLAHGVFYGLFLEVRWSGKYSIIWPTLQAHLEDIRKMLQEIFG
jgi:hypothetical protein